MQKPDCHQPTESQQDHHEPADKQQDHHEPTGKQQDPGASQSFPASNKSCEWELIRIKGQQKLLYIKQARTSKMDGCKFFQQYPSSQFDFFAFPVESLQSSGIVFRDQDAIHWVQSVGESDSAQALESQTCDSGTNKSLNGWGISLFDNGKVFEGRYHDSEPCQFGYELLPNGNTYIGEFKSGTKSGQGTYYWFNSNEMFTGEWLNGLPHGHGKYLSGNDEYSGGFSNGLKHGNGQQLFANGDRYVGEHFNGVADGYGEYFWADGSFFKGDFRQGARHGFGVWSDLKGTEVFSGSYRMDKKQGFGVYEWSDKQVYKGQFKQDFRQGFGKLYRILKNSDLRSQEKLVYSGMWERGLKKSGAPADRSVIEQLQLFINEKKLNSHNCMPKIGHQNCVSKIGHQNCVPKTT